MAPADPEAKIQCPTPQHLQSELDSLAAVLALGEKEETWDKMEKALIRFAGVTRGGGYKHLPLFTDGIGRKGCASKVAECMLSDRGRLSTAAVEFLQAFAPRLHDKFAPVVQPYFEPLLKLFARPNKVFLKRSEKCLTKILENCQLPQIILELRKGLNDDAVTCRRICSIGIERAVNEWEVEVFTEKSLVSLEEGLRRMATDKDAEVRQTGKRVWARFMDIWPERVDDFSAPLTPTIRRYLNLPAQGQGAAVKGKGKAKAIPPARPALPAASTSASVQAPTRTDAARPQPLRVAALTSKPSRPALRQTPPVESEQRHPQPTIAVGREPSPRKIESRPVRPEAHAKQAMYQGMGLGAMPNRPDVAPLPHGRSASHTVLPTTYSSTSISEQNSLSRPNRPILPQSFSTTALPNEASTSQAPYVGRFATGPMRIVRPAPMPMADDTDPSGQITMGADGFLYTPSGGTVFGGPSRPPPQAQVHLGRGGRKPGMGAAQRRIVTAPPESSGLGYPTRTPAANKFLTRTVKGKAEEVEEFPFSIPAFQPNLDPRTPGAKSRIAQDSPLLPVLRNSSQDIGNEDLRETSMLQESIDLIRTIEGPVPVELAAQIPLPLDEGEVVRVRDNVVPVAMAAEETILAVPSPTALEQSSSAVESTATEPPSVTMPSAIALNAESSLKVDQEMINPAIDQVKATAIAPTSIGELAIESQAEVENAVESEPMTLGPTVETSEMSALGSVPIAERQEEAQPNETTQTSAALEPPMIASAEQLSDPSASTSVRRPAALPQAGAVLTANVSDVGSIPPPAQISSSHEGSMAESAPEAKSDPVKAASSSKVNDAKPTVAARVVSGRFPTTKAPAKPTQSASTSAALASAPAPPRKPPVPRAAAVSKMTRPIERKPFRPATAAQTAALAKSRVVSQPLVERPPVSQSSVTSKATAVEPRSRQVSASSSQAASSTAPVRAVTATVPNRTIAKPSTLLAPTKASSSRAATVSHIKPTVSTATASSSALPPVRKEKIKLKAALPSFRPVRSGAVAPQPQAVAGPGNGTFKSTSSTRSIASQPVARAPLVKVKPEAIPLPHSPVAGSSTSTNGKVDRQVQPEQVALPASPADRLSQKRPESMALPASPVERALESYSTSNNVVMTLGMSSSRHIRITPAEAVPLPDSPAATRDEMIPTDLPEPIAPGAVLALHSNPVQTANTVPLPESPISETAQLTQSRVARHSIPQAMMPLQADRGITPTPSKASTMSDLDSDSDSEDDDDLTGVTFKVRPDGPREDNAAKLKPKVHLGPSGDLMDFSSPKGPGPVSNDKLAFVSTTPKYTPGRRVLESRNANVSSPLVMRGAVVDQEEEEDW